jgi:hypothetical protein
MQQMIAMIFAVAFRVAVNGSAFRPLLAEPIHR